MTGRPKLAVWKFASCDGCQLTLLDCEDELLEIAARFGISHFLEASNAQVKGPYDLSIVEGSITTPQDAERIRRIRRQSKVLVTIGACATAGGIQALRNFRDIKEFMSVVYARPEYIDTLATSTAIQDHVPVDFELRGCPPSKQQLLEVLSAFLAGRRPHVPSHSQCVECKLNGTVCIMVAHGVPCLGPVTQAGCGNLCPSRNRGCYGCFGPKETSNTASLAGWMSRLGQTDRQIAHAFRSFNANAEAFRQEADAHDAECTGSPATRTIRVGTLARVEGEGALYVRVRDGQVRDLKFSIYEPPRFFEALLRGRSYMDAPDFTSRICGICPVAYIMSSSQAIEAALGMEVPQPIRDLRRLLYCGEWIQSHVLHMALLHAPDFAGCADGIEMTKRHPGVVEKALGIKKLGNDLMARIGGRPIHPVNTRIGGFYKAPDLASIRNLIEPLKQAVEDMGGLIRFFAGFDFPDIEFDYTFVALHHPDRYAIEEGRITSNRGLDIAVPEFEEHVAEEQVAHSTALRSSLNAGTDRVPYLTGPLARYSLNFGQLSPLAQAMAGEAGLGPVCHNPFRSLLVRAVEVLYACEEALHLAEAYERFDPDFIEAEPRPGKPRPSRGHGATEAPRGLLYHRYDLDDEGRITNAVIMPPTSQNQLQIEQDLREVVQRGLDLDDAALTARCEQAIRNYDPCISCSTHFLRLEVDRGAPE